jgi:hypothetical protein
MSPNTSLELYSIIVFFISILSLSIILGILGFEGIVFEVVASLVSSFSNWTPLEIFGTVQLGGSTFFSKVV